MSATVTEPKVVISAQIAREQREALEEPEIVAGPGRGDDRQAPRRVL